MEGELGLLPLLAGVLPVPVPVVEHVVRDRDGAVAMAVHRMLDGAADDRRRAGRPAGGGRDRALDDLAAVLGALRRVPPDAAGVRLRPHQGFGHPSQRELHRRLRGRIGAADAARVEALWRAFEAEPRVAPVLAHADLKPEHVLHDPRSGRLTGVLDWGDACLVAPGLRPRGRGAVLRRGDPRRPRRAACRAPTCAGSRPTPACSWSLAVRRRARGARRRRAVRGRLRRRPSGRTSEAAGRNCAGEGGSGVAARAGAGHGRTAAGEETWSRRAWGAALDATPVAGASGGDRRRRRSSRPRWCGSGARAASSPAPAAPPPPPTPANVDSRRSARSPPHSGHATGSSGRRTSSSKRSAQVSQRYS